MSPPGDQSMHRLLLFSTRAMKTAQRCKNENIPRKERKRTTNQRDIEAATHNRVKIDAKLVNLHNYPHNSTISFRWNREIICWHKLPWAIIQSEAWLRLQCSSMSMLMIASCHLN